MVFKSRVWNPNHGYQNYPWPHFEFILSDNQRSPSFGRNLTGSYDDAGPHFSSLSQMKKNMDLTFPNSRFMSSHKLIKVSRCKYHEDKCEPAAAPCSDSAHCTFKWEREKERERKKKSCRSLSLCVEMLHCCLAHTHTQLHRLHLMPEFEPPTKCRMSLHFIKFRIEQFERHWNIISVLLRASTIALRRTRNLYMQIFHKSQEYSNFETFWNEVIRERARVASSPFGEVNNPRPRFGDHCLRNMLE